MMRWLKKKLRDWLLEEPKASDDKFLEVVIRDTKGARREMMQPTSVCGLCLRCTPFGDTGEMIVAKHQAIDEDKFDRIWNRLAGNPKIEWED